jgi:hypothetical protein
MTGRVATAWASIVENFESMNDEPIVVPKKEGAFSVDHHNIVEHNIIEGISSLASTIDANEITKDDLRNLYAYMSTLVSGTSLPLINYIPEGGFGTQYYAPASPFNGSLVLEEGGDLTLTVTCPTNQLNIVIRNTVTGVENKTEFLGTGVKTIESLFAACNRTYEPNVPYLFFLTAYKAPSAAVAPASFGIGGDSKKYYLSYTFS